MDEFALKSNNIATTRARGFYTLVKTRRNSFDMNILKEAIIDTADKRNSSDMKGDWKSILNDIKNEEALMTLWQNYPEVNRYIPDTGFDEFLDVVEEISMKMNYGLSGIAWRASR